MRFFLKTKSLIIASIFLELILFYFYYFPENKILFGDEVRYLETGFNIAKGGDWHPNPLWPPMQSILIALFSKVFSLPILPLQLFQYGLLLLAGFILRDIVFRETKSQKSAQFSLAVMILYPSWLAYSQYLWPEVMHVSLFLAVFWINNYKSNNIKWLLLSGFLLGLCLLFKSLLVLFIPFLYLPLFYKFKVLKALKLMALSVAITIITIAPAANKAHKMTDVWMISDSSSFNLLLGLNDDVRQHFKHKLAGKYYSEYMQSADNFKQRNITSKNKALIQIKTDGYFSTFINQIKKQYFRLFDHQTFFSQQFQSSDNRFVNKYQHKTNEWLVQVMLVVNNFIYIGLLVMTFLGIKTSFNSSIIARQFILLTLYILGIFLFLHAIPRYRIPLVPIMAFFSAFAFHKNYKFTLQSSLMLMIIVISSAFLAFAASYMDKYFPI